MVETSPEMKDSLSQALEFSKDSIEELTQKIQSIEQTKSNFLYEIAKKFNDKTKSIWKKRKFKDFTFKEKSYFIKKIGMLKDREGW
jgi:hypothetical protein